MSSLESICEICGRPYIGLKCIKCTQTSVSVADFGFDSLNPSMREDEITVAADAPGVAKLKITESGRLYPVAKPVCRLGHDPANDIVLTLDPAVSKFHAHIRFEDGEYVLRDLGTREGTWLNGERISSEQILFQGDHIRIGSTRFYFMAEPKHQF